MKYLMVIFIILISMSCGNNSSDISSSKSSIYERINDDILKLPFENDTYSKGYIEPDSLPWHDSRDLESYITMFRLPEKEINSLKIVSFFFNSLNTSKNDAVIFLHNITLEFNNERKLSEIIYRNNDNERISSPVFNGEYSLKKIGQYMSQFDNLAIKKSTTKKYDITKFYSQNNRLVSKTVVELLRTEKKVNILKLWDSTNDSKIGVTSDDNEREKFKYGIVHYVEYY